MFHRRFFTFLLLTALFLVAACAPENLDITPTPVPSPVPTIKVDVKGAVNDPKVVELIQGSRVQDAIDAAGGAAENADLTRLNLAQILSDGAAVTVPVVGENTTSAASGGVTEATAEAPVVAPERVLLEYIVSTIPGNITAGTISWRRDPNATITWVERDGGATARLAFIESGGGAMELTFGVFPSNEVALSVFERTKTSIEQQVQLKENDEFPKPNGFGQGTYGRDAIFVRDNIYIRVAVPRLSGSAADPLVPMGREAFKILDSALASYTPPG